MYWSAALALAAGVNAQFGGGGVNMLRFGCEQVTIQRLDPLVNPGQAPSTHMHQVIGGNAFNASMPPTDISKEASCTTCGPVDDLSNYWTANLYFKARNGTYKRVQQAANRLLFGDNFSAQTQQGAVVYYVSPGAGKVTAFKPGFRMLTGDNTRRAAGPNGWRYQSCYRCYTGPNHGGDNAAPCQDPVIDTEQLPPKPCRGGIRTNLLYPTCWDGKNLDSADHQAHVAYPTAGFSRFLSRGACPSTHPVQIPQIMLEIVWDTVPFNDQSQWPADGSQPFTLSMGDGTGYGQHGDYVFGWKGDSLQKAMDDPKGGFGPNLGGLVYQTNAEARKCVVEPMINEDVDGWLSSLPGQKEM